MRLARAAAKRLHALPAKHFAACPGQHIAAPRFAVHGVALLLQLFHSLPHRRAGNAQAVRQLLAGHRRPLCRQQGC